METCTLLLESPIGPLTLRSDGAAVTALLFGARGETSPLPCPVLNRAALELAEYFAGKRRRFTIPLSPAGTDFQRWVWAALKSIPYGETITYGALAARIGNPRACRAVGMANNRNPIPIFIPCHRVVGADGSLTGYAGGLDAKRLLLELEGSGRRSQNY